MAEQRKLLGYGKSRDFSARPGSMLEEEGKAVYEVDPAFYCTVCDGCGCRCGGFTGEEGKRIERNRVGKNGLRRKKS